MPTELTITTRHLIRCVVMLAALCASQFCFAQPQSQLIAVEKDGKTGFIDQTGKVVIPFQFDRANSFYEGLALVTRKDRKFFIDTTGRVLFEAKYDVVRDFSEGLCAVNIGQKTDRNNGVMIETGKWGYIDKTGKLVIPMKFTHAESFSEGWAAIKNGDHGAFIDHDTKIMFEITFDVTAGFREGIVAVFYRGTLAYFDRTGKQISPPLRYGKDHSFSEGLVPVAINRKTGFMDRTGKLAIEPQFEDAEDFSEGLAPVKVRGEAMTRCEREPSGYRESFRMKWGYIDRTGKMIIPPEFESADRFSEGLGAINQCGEGYFIDKTGKKIVLGKFSQVSPFAAGVSRINVGVNEDRMWALIDKTGKIIWGPTKRW
jgi:hypothetical protein